MAAVRELWTTRDHIARRRDIAPGRILPDSAIINAATADPKTVEELTALPGVRRVQAAPHRAGLAGRIESGPRRRRPAGDLRTAERSPAASRWARRKPEAAARLEAARAGLAELSERVSVPTENLVTPEVVRRLCWDWQPADDTESAVDDFLRDAQARLWQRELVVPVLAAALATPAP